MDKAAAPPAGRPQYCSGSRDDVTPAVTLSLLGPVGVTGGSTAGAWGTSCDIETRVRELKHRVKFMGSSKRCCNGLKRELPSAGDLDGNALLLGPCTGAPFCWGLARERPFAGALRGSALLLGPCAGSPFCWGLGRDLPSAGALDGISLLLGPCTGSPFC
ncbi:hypothetical protein NDU88_013057 [Pleurodeles waltl]|uniref:Uncharacterized protein n=1 Tax=Pleurodeles waltl TaxID=8319 RepID=A0AAV7R3C1_PLEWA|nr:hypothetical protein NDU88_013057 [Pleurodeles waltl]